MGTEYPDALDYFVDDSRVFGGVNTQEVIVLHGTGGSATQTVEQLGDWFRSDPNEASVHFGVGRDGRVAQYVRLADGAAGNCCIDPGFDPFWRPYWDQYSGLPGKLNRCTISIEHVNDASNSLPLTDAQKAASFKLVKWLCDTLNIPHDHIKTHASIAPINRARCPGNYPKDELDAFLKGGNTMNIPQGWTDDGQVLTAPNGHKVVLGFRQWILQNGVDKLGEPLEDEHGANPVEEYWAQIPPDGTSQLFNFGKLGCTTERKVYLIGIGNELRGARADRDKAKADLANAQKAIAALQQQVQLLQSGSPLADYRTRLQQINTLSQQINTLSSI